MLGQFPAQSCSDVECPVQLLGDPPLGVRCGLKTIRCTPLLDMAYLVAANSKSYSRTQLMDELQRNDANSKQQASFLYVIFDNVRIRRSHKQEADSRNHH